LLYQQIVRGGVRGVMDVCVRGGTAKNAEPRTWPAQVCERVLTPAKFEGEGDVGGL
jgi:hypothetical protein